MNPHYGIFDVEDNKTAGAFFDLPPFLGDTSLNAEEQRDLDRGLKILEHYQDENKPKAEPDVMDRMFALEQIWKADKALQASFSLKQFVAIRLKK